MKGEFTEEQIRNIRENLRKAGFDRLPVSLKVRKLYGEKFEPREGDRLWVHLPTGDRENGIGEGWHEIRVTHYRSGVVFFKYGKGRKEHYADRMSYLIQEAIPMTLKLKEAGIHDRNLPFIKFDFEARDGRLYTTVVRQDGTTFKVRNTQDDGTGT